MPLLIYEGYSGRTILPLLRPGRTNKSLNVFGKEQKYVGRLAIIREGRLLSKKTNRGKKN